MDSVRMSVSSPAKVRRWCQMAAPVARAWNHWTLYSSFCKKWRYHSTVVRGLPDSALRLPPRGRSAVDAGDELSLLRFLAFRLARLRRRLVHHAFELHAVRVGEI